MATGSNHRVSVLNVVPAMILPWLNFVSSWVDWNRRHRWGPLREALRMPPMRFQEWCFALGLGAMLGLSPLLPRTVYAGAVKSGGSYTIEKDVMSNGGVEKTGGSYSASAVIAQPAGYKDMTGGVYVVHGGYYGGHDDDPPTVYSVVLLDTDSDGVINEAVVSFSEPMKDSTINVADVVAGFSITGGTVGSVDNVTDAGGFAKANAVDPGVADDNFITLSVSGYTLATAPTTVAFTYQAGRFHDHSQLQMQSQASLTVVDQAAPVLQYVQGRVGSANLLVQFSEPVYSTPGAGNLVNTDFTYTDIDDSRGVSSVSHTGGQSMATVILGFALDNANDLSTDTLAAAATNIYDNAGNAAPTTPVMVTERVLVWSGVVNTTMSNAGNWDKNRVPSAEDRLVITNNGSTPATVDVGLATVGGVTVNAGATLDGGGQTLTNQGDFLVSGVFNPAGGGVSFTGAGPYTLSASSLGGLQVSGPTVVVSASNLAVAANLDLNGILSVSAGLDVALTGDAIGTGGNVELSGSSTFTVNGNLNLGGSGIVCAAASTCNIRLLGQVSPLGGLTAGLGTVEYGRTTGIQNVLALTYNNLVISNSGQTATLAGVATVSGDFTLVLNGQFDGASNLLTVKGNVTTLGANPDPFLNTVLTLTGAGNTQQISVSDELTGLTVNKTGGVARVANTFGSLPLGNFTLTSGEFDLNGKIVAMNGPVLMQGGVLVADLTGSKLTSVNPGTVRYALEVNGATLSVSNLIVESTNANGLSFSAGTITALDNVEWRQGQTRFARFDGALGALCSHSPPGPGESDQGRRPCLSLAAHPSRGRLRSHSPHAGAGWPLVALGGYSQRDRARAHPPP